MRIHSHRKSIFLFTALGVCMVALAVVLNIGWVLLNWRQVALLVLGVMSFAKISSGCSFQ